MNISELTAYLNSHPKVIRAVFPPLEGMTDHTTYFFLKIYATSSENLATDQAYVIIVKDRGLPTETIYFKTALPDFMQSTTFKDRVKTAIATYQSTHPELKWYEIATVDEINKVARVTAYEYNNTDQVLNAKQYLVWDKDGSLQRETVI